MALPAEARRRWGLGGGGAVDVADLGDALLIVPGGQRGLRAMLGDAIERAGGSEALASEVADDEPELR